MPADTDIMRDRVLRLFGRAVLRFDPGRLEGWVELGLTMTQLRVLFLLWAEGGASAGTLAERLNVTPSTLTRIIDRLVRQKLVRRDSDDCDRRLVRHYLSESGANTVKELERGGRARMNDVLDRLSAEQVERLVLALDDFAGALEAQEAEDLSGVEA